MFSLCFPINSLGGSRDSLRVKNGSLFYFLQGHKSFWRKLASPQNLALDSIMVIAWVASLLFVRVIVGEENTTTQLAGHYSLRFLFHPANSMCSSDSYVKYIISRMSWHVGQLHWGREGRNIYPTIPDWTISTNTRKRIAQYTVSYNPSLFECFFCVTVRHKANFHVKCMNSEKFLEYNFKCILFIPKWLHLV